MVKNRFFPIYNKEPWGAPVISAAEPCQTSVGSQSESDMSKRKVGGAHGPSIDQAGWPSPKWLQRPQLPPIACFEGPHV